MAEEDSLPRYFRHHLVWDRTTPGRAENAATGLLPSSSERLPTGNRRWGTEEALGVVLGWVTSQVFGSQHMFQAARASEQGEVYEEQSGTIFHDNLDILLHTASTRGF